MKAGGGMSLSKSLRASTAPAASFSKAFQRNLLIIALLSAASSVIMLKHPSRTFHPLILSTQQTIFALSATLFGFVKGSLLPSGVKAILNPVVTCVAITLSSLYLFSNVAGVGFLSLLQAYKTGSSCPVHLGAGDILLFLLGPSVIGFAVQMYEQRAKLSSKLRQVLAATVGASFVGLFGTAAAARAFCLGEAYRLSTVSRQLTSPLAIACADLLKADVSLAVTLVVLTGLVGSNFGAAMMNKLSITNPVTRGLSMGASAHGLGTAALASDEPEAGAFSAISMALTGTISTIIVACPPLRAALRQIAGI